MRKALFIGASDISDLLQYVSKVISTTGKKVLLVDGTNEKYVFYATSIPSYELNIVEYEGFDVAFGFNSLSELEDFLEHNQQYQQLILHCDKTSFLSKEDLNKFETRFVATSQEKISIDKTVEVMKTIFNQTDEDEKNTRILFNKILVSNVESNMTEDYLEMVLDSLPLTWNEDPFELLFDEVDFATKINNQHEGNINIRRISRNYKKVIQLISEDVSGLEDKEIKSSMKQIMRRSFAWGK